MPMIEPRELGSLLFLKIFNTQHCCTSLTRAFATINEVNSIYIQPNLTFRINNRINFVVCLSIRIILFFFILRQSIY